MVKARRADSTSAKMETPRSLRARPQHALHQGQAARVHASCSPTALPTSAKHRGKFTNLRDSVKKSPTKSTAKVKAGSGWWSDSSWSSSSYEKVCISKC